MSILIPKETGILVPSIPDRLQPKSMGRRSVLSAIGAAGASIAMPASVGLSMLAPDRALAATAPTGSLKIQYAISQSTPSPGVNVYKYYEWYYISSNSTGYQEVRVWERTRTTYTGGATTQNSYKQVGGTARFTLSAMVVEKLDGTDVCTIPIGDFDGAGPGTCRRLNTSGTENIDAAYKQPGTGWTNYAVVKCVRLGTEATEYLYKKYKSPTGEIYYRLFARVGAAGGLAATSLIKFTGASKETVENVNKFVGGFSELSAARAATLTLASTTTMATAVGIGMGVATAYGADALMSTSSGLLAAIATGAATGVAYYTYARKLVDLEQAINYFPQNGVDDPIDCV